MGVLMKQGVNYSGFGAKNIAVAHYDSIGIPQVFFSDKAGNKINCGSEARYITTITTSPIAFFKWKHTNEGSDWVVYGAVSLRPLTYGVDYSHNNEHADLVDPVILVINGVTAYVYKESGGWSFSNNPDVVINDTYHITNLYATDNDITSTSKFMKDIIATLTDNYILPQEAVVRYSTTERIIGTWIDGSPLYEKTFYVPTLSTGNNVQTHGITNFDKLISAEGFFYRNGTVQVKVPTSSPSAATYNADITDITSTTFNIEVGSSWSSYTLTNAYITIRYTKTSS